MRGRLQPQRSESRCASRSSSRPSRQTPSSVEPVVAQDADAPEAGHLVAADRALVVGGGVDREAVVAEISIRWPAIVLTASMPSPRPWYGAPRKRSIPACRNSSSSSSKYWIIPATSSSTRTAKTCAVVRTASLLEHVLVREPAPPARDLRVGAELDDPRHVRLCERPQHDTISPQLHDDPVTPAATTLPP